MSKPFRIEHEGPLPAPPEVVWDAVTRDTGAWLFADDGGESPPLEWDPPRRAVFREEAGDWFNQLEFTLEPAGDGTYLRYVHSGILVDDWENQYDGARRHTELYQHNLEQYLRHFAGRSFRHFEVPAPAGSITPDAVDAVRDAWGIGPETPVGSTLQLTLPAVGAVTAELDFHNEAFIGLRTPDALYRVFGRNHFGGPVAIGGYEYGDDRLPIETTTAAWSAWLAQLYPDPA